MNIEDTAVRSFVRRRRRETILDILRSLGSKPPPAERSGNVEAVYRVMYWILDDVSTPHKSPNGVMWTHLRLTWEGLACGRGTPNC